MLKLISPVIVSLHPPDRNFAAHTPRALDLSSILGNILSTSPGLGIGEIDELK
jgi:hypothetical protein